MEKVVFLVNRYFPGRTWYKNRLHPAPANADARLALKKSLYKSSEYDQIIDPAKPVVLVLADHQGCSQKSDMEAELMAAPAHELMRFYGLSPDQMALISPHRAQNNAIIKKLGKKIPEGMDLPLVDTIERVQGSERDIIVLKNF